MLAPYRLHATSMGSIFDVFAEGVGGLPHFPPNFEACP